MKSATDPHRIFYVDEAGDLTLFDKKGRIIVGSEGVSKFFMVGLAYIADVEKADRELSALRKRLLVDPYFNGVPSLQPDKNKTAIKFHAKDDLPEIRREVFQLLPTLGVKVIVAIRQKKKLAELAQEYFKLTGKKINEHFFYDDLVKRLFRNVLHTAEQNTIVFARRGKSAREEALSFAIRRAQENFKKKWNTISEKPTTIFSAYPHEHTGLQVIDYYLWALQRLYEKREHRFFTYLASDYRLIMDLDDTRRNEYGEWYSDKNILGIEKIKPESS